MGADDVSELIISRSCAPTMILQPGTQWDLKRQQAARSLYKIKKTSKGKLGRKSNHMGSSKGTHTTLRCCVDGAFGNPQKTGIIASIHTSIAAIAALPIAQGGYRNRILYSYHSVLLDIRLFTAAGRTGR